MRIFFRMGYHLPSTAQPNLGQTQNPTLSRSPSPKAVRSPAVAHVRPISIADIVNIIPGPDPMRVNRDFHRVYIPEGFVVVNIVVAGQPDESRCSEFKHKAENITRSYSEVSGNSSQAEAARILKTITSVAPVVFLAPLARSPTARRPGRRRRRLSCVVCQLMGSRAESRSRLVPRDVIYSFVQVNTRMQGN